MNPMRQKKKRIHRKKIQNIYRFKVGLFSSLACTNCQERSNAMLNHLQNEEGEEEEEEEGEDQEEVFEVYESDKLTSLVFLISIDLIISTAC